MSDNFYPLAKQSFGATRLPRLRVCIINADGDAGMAERLKEFFQLVGIESWCRGDLVGGEQLAVRGRHEIHESHFVIVLLSKKSVSTSGDHNRMTNWALDMAEEMPEGAIKVIPARLEDCQVPPNLGRLWSIDFFVPRAWDSLVASFKKEWARRKAANDW